MDITFKTEQGRFNYRVCAIIINNQKILAMRDQLSPYYYLPGGRVSLHETAENAVLREIKEELKVDAEIIRPLWINQSFFVQDVNHEKYHEICLYFLVDISKTNLFSKGEKFTIYEDEFAHEFEWLDFNRLKSEYFYPIFLKDKIFDLPKELIIITEYQ
ncbi:MAG: NUDIX hydrolase [Intestinibacter sp.]|uniref:NUDIX hydrolase n=1 Tax=Intestinibacter sp. TaxID=1965304 RepID=UPI003F18874D